MSKQVVTIGADGTISGLQVKKGKGVVLSELGNAEIKRATLIEFDSCHQAWFIRVLDDEPQVRGWMQGIQMDCSLEGEEDTLTWGHWYRAMGEDCPASELKKVVWSNDYDRAVQIEIEFLNALRKQGIHSGI